MNYRVDRGGRIAVSCEETGREAAARLCAALSGYRPPAQIAELQTEIGFAAMNLEAILLPRPANAQEIDLPMETRLTLRDADHLIVMLNDATSEDRFVDEEIRTFLAHQTGRELGQRLLPVRLSGADDAAWPEALQEKGVEPIADLRDGKDGWTKGMTLVRAAVLGVPMEQLDKLERERERRRAMNMLYAVGGAAVAATVAAICIPMMS